MKPQQLFNLVVRHLLQQGARSERPVGLCAYRGDNGLSCAVGCLISDEHYSKDIEGRQVFSTQVRQALAASGVTLDATTQRLLTDMQRLHDTIEARDWYGVLQKLGLRYGLEMPNELT